MGLRSTIIGQTWSGQGLAAARVALDHPDATDRLIERRRHGFVHGKRIIAFDEDRRVAITKQQIFKFVRMDPGKHGRIGDFIAVEMKDRQHGTISLRIEKLVAVPRGRQWPGLCFSVTDHAGDDQIGVVESGAIRVRQ